jgi:hypothetical protein
MKDFEIQQQNLEMYEEGCDLSEEISNPDLNNNDEEFDGNYEQCLTNKSNTY